MGALSALSVMATTMASYPLVVEFATTWALVRISPSAEMMVPEPAQRPLPSASTAMSCTTERAMVSVSATGASVIGTVVTAVVMSLVSVTGTVVAVPVGSSSPRVAAKAMPPATSAATARPPTSSAVRRGRGAGAPAGGPAGGPEGGPGGGAEPQPEAAGGIGGTGAGAGAGAAGCHAGGGGVGLPGGGRFGPGAPGVPSVIVVSSRMATHPATGAAISLDVRGNARPSCQRRQGALGDTEPGAVSTSTPSSVTRHVCSN